MMRNLKAIYTILLTSIPLAACSGVEYMDNHSISQTEYLNSHQRYELKNGHNKLRQLGAFVMNHKQPKVRSAVQLMGQQEPEPRVFMIKRNKDVVRAETMLFESDDTKKTTFDRSYFSVGADRSKKSVGFQFRFLY